MQTYQEIIKQMLGNYRYRHSLCVAQAARELAVRYGADFKKAETAGLLHDIAKDMPKAEQLKLLTRFDIILSTVERNAEKLWHAILGAAYLREVLQITDAEILNAVRYHTTGRAKMSLLEKVVFVADFISADRTYPGVEKMREWARDDLDEAVLEGIVFTLGELAKRRQPIHPDMIAAYNEITLIKK